MLINKNITKFFEHDKLELIGTLIASAIFIIRNCDKDNYLLDKILEASSINLEAPLFLKKLEEHLDLLKKDNNSNIYFSSELRHSPSALQNSPVSWQYYAIYFAFNLGSEEIYKSKDDPVLSELLKLPLNFHYSYLKYKNFEEKGKLHISERQQDHFYKNISIGVVRTIEYLAKFYFSKNEHLYETYLSNQKDHFENLVELSNNDIVEKDCFYIAHDPKLSNFIKYENTDLGISIQVLSSRKITSGVSTGKEFNSKITNYLSDAFESYKKLTNLHLKKILGNKSGGTARKNILQATEEEKFIIENDIEDLTLNSEDKEQINEQNQRSIKKARSSLVPVDDSVEEPKDIGNRFMQYKKNISFSASITKSKLLLKTEYKIPEVNHLKEFIHYISSNNEANFYEIENFSKAIFILSIVFGFTVDDAISFLYNENKNIKRLQNGRISVAIDSELFAKYRVNPLLQKRSFTINYVLQDYMHRLINKLINHIFLFSNLAYYFKNMKWERLSKVPLIRISNNIRAIVSKNRIDNFSKFKEDYLSSMKKLINEFDKEINIDFKNMWKITLSFSKLFFKDDTIAMLSIAKYQKNDTAKLSYSSTEKFSQKHSLLLESICNALDIPNAISRLLNIEYKIYNHTFSSVEPIFLGSHKAVYYKDSKKFFESLYELIFKEDDKTKKFNLVSIYIRYSMSILCATRDFKNSSTIKNISFFMHTQMITEKSESKLNGIRIIPLCETIERIIKYYNQICNDHGIYLDCISLYDNDKLVKFDKKIAFKIIASITNDKFINDFIKYVPLNTGRHIINQYKIEKKLNSIYIETFLGHYISGAEQLGIYSPLHIPGYIHYIRENMQNIANLFGIRELS